MRGTITPWSVLPTGAWSFRLRSRNSDLKDRWQRLMSYISCALHNSCARSRRRRKKQDNRVTSPPLSLSLSLSLKPPTHARTRTCSLARSGSSLPSRSTVERGGVPFLRLLITFSWFIPPLQIPTTHDALLSQRHSTSFFKLAFAIGILLCESSSPPPTTL